MALNKKFKDIDKVYDKIGYNNADCLFQAMGKSPDYMYMGFLSQAGSDAPTSEVLYNDFLPENKIIFSYKAIGIYRIYCNLFKPGYTEVEVNETQTQANVIGTLAATVYDGYIELVFLRLGMPFDNQLYKTPIKIKVWTNAAVSISTPVPPVLGIFIAPFTIDSSTSIYINTNGFVANQNTFPFYYAVGSTPYDTGMAMRTAITNLSINTGALIDINNFCSPGTTGWLWVTGYSSPTNWEVLDWGTLTNFPLGFMYAGNDLSTADYETVYTYNPGSTINDVQIYQPTGGGSSCGPGIIMGGFGLGLVGLMINDPDVDMAISGFGGRDCTFQLVDNGLTLTIKINNCVKTFAPSTIYLNDVTGPGNYVSLNFVEL
jgi:hypothetical protein